MGIIPDPGFSLAASTGGGRCAEGGDRLRDRIDAVADV